jgi:hypothetical protein
VYAFDRKGGKPVWQVPAVIDQYGLPLHQPVDVPVLTFLRHVNQAAAAPGQRTSLRGSVLCLDKRDGRILLRKDDIATQIHSFEIVADTDRQVVQVSLPGKLFTLKFTDEPAPPEPPAQTGAPQRAGGLAEAGRSLRTFAGVLFDALTPSVKGRAAEEKAKAATNDPQGGQNEKAAENAAPPEGDHGAGAAAQQEARQEPQQEAKEGGAPAAGAEAKGSGKN